MEDLYARLSIPHKHFAGALFVFLPWPHSPIPVVFPAQRQERCVSGDATELALTVKTEPGETFFPGLVEGDVLLSFTPIDSQAQSSSSASSSGNGTGSGLVWTVQAVETTNLMVWTVFPSTGLLLPGQRCVHARPNIIPHYNLGSTSRPLALPGTTTATTI